MVFLTKFREPCLNNILVTLHCCINAICYEN